MKPRLGISLCRSKIFNHRGYLWPQRRLYTSAATYHTAGTRVKLLLHYESKLERSHVILDLSRPTIHWIAIEMFCKSSQSPEEEACWLWWSLCFSHQDISQRYETEVIPGRQQADTLAEQDAHRHRMTEEIKNLQQNTLETAGEAENSASYSDVTHPWALNRALKAFKKVPKERVHPHWLWPLNFWMWLKSLRRISQRQQQRLSLSGKEPVTRLGLRIPKK